jgi:hypothetical protein
MIFIQLSQQLQSLSKLLITLTNEQYNKKIAHLGNASIGGHTRHIIELLKCAITGCLNGEVDYVNRIRNLSLETDKTLAQLAIKELYSDMRMPDKQLILIVEQLTDSAELQTVTTTYFREIVYNTEHTLHHLALIKVAIIDMKLDMVDNDFGMAYSTIKYQTSLTT